MDSTTTTKPDSGLIYILDEETGEYVPTLIEDIESHIKSVEVRLYGGFVHKVDNFLHLPLLKVPFFIKDWLPKQGRLEIVGQPKSGKSTAAIQMAKCLGVGTPFLGLHTDACRVLYIQSELGIEVLQSRMKVTATEYPNVYVGTVFDLMLDTKAGQDRLTEAMIDVQPDVLILDPLYKMMLGDENMTVDVRKVLNFLDALLGKFNCSVVVMHHPGKDLEKGGRGSSILEGWFDTVIDMRMTQPTGLPTTKSNGQRIHYVKLISKLMRHAPPLEDIECRLDDNLEFTVVSERKPVIDRVLEAIVSLGKRVSSKDIEAQVDASHKSIYDALGELVRTGKVARVSRGAYEWIKPVNTSD